MNGRHDIRVCELYEVCYVNLDVLDAVSIVNIIEHIS